MKTLLYSLTILLFASCNSHKKTASTSAPVPLIDYSKLSITYQRTPCFGKCPTYTLTINGATKTAIYKGEQNIEKIGMFTKPITEEEIKQFVDAFEKANFNGLNDAYLGEISDFPMDIITYSDKGKTKTVKDRDGAPAQLKVLEKTLNDFANTTEGWVKSETADH
jgi:hypothetical protein